MADSKYPDAMITLATAVHSFHRPEISGKAKISYEESFKTVGSHPRTKAMMQKGDIQRATLTQAMLACNQSTMTNDNAFKAAEAYLPRISQVILSCKVQPEMARLDKALFFEWTSGLENNKKPFKSEAMMYELVMTLASMALAKMGAGSDASNTSDYPLAGREFKAAAGIMQCLADEQLPTWVSHGSSNSNSKDLPVEVSVGVCEAFKIYCLAVGQQMAVATVLAKPVAPNYSLLAKLSLGIAEHMELFDKTFNSKAALQKEKIDINFFAVVAFETQFHRALSLYFAARGLWTAHDFGVAIPMMKEAIAAMETRKTPVAKGLPSIDSKTSPFKHLSGDLKEVRSHMVELLKSWEKDNATIYYEEVRRVIPQDKILQKGLIMMKSESYAIEHVEPLLLSDFRK
mmetsp:Transcript_8971/g.12418  ORF Transcript_8971/g.12418 Transcript_8971/m.12418 type:complete len:402 (-) Transcript_8971:498-1703(-)|eukprot:CAMPEP_0185736288 /NCGR_PEP_ID=MMETSP1171-20130828/27451_1 /TAXON_ID=374046 /ORGANISM="Helicotheca tamensis, Strain CCMP826" /LENGTH=401 /DNA_ID=CAMNT_0028406845 /DNA_START=43 /DNA_END=1248 /DNA_ORIENTATION=-